MIGQGDNPCLFIYRISSINSVSVQLVACVCEVWQFDECVQCQQQRQCQQLEHVQPESGSGLIPPMARQSRFYPCGIPKSVPGGWKERISRRIEISVNMYPDVTGRTLLAWYRIDGELVFHARCPMRLVPSIKLLIQSYRTGYHFVAESGD